MFKVKNNLAPEIMKKLCTPKISPYDSLIIIRFREKSRFCLAQHWISVQGPKIWNLVRDEIKQSENLNAFKFRNKKVGP